MFEAYSVLTRLPAPRRIDPALARLALAHAFPQPPASLPARRVMPLLQLLEAAGISGGATYDAIVAETARRRRSDARFVRHESEIDLQRRRGRRHVAGLTDGRVAAYSWTSSMSVPKLPFGCTNATVVPRLPGRGAWSMAVAPAAIMLASASAQLSTR